MKSISVKSIVLQTAYNCEKKFSYCQHRSDWRMLLIAASAAKPPLMVLAYKSSSFAADYDSITDKELISGKWRGVLNDEGVELSLSKNGSLKAVYNHKK